MMVVVAASLGGLDALQRVLGGLPSGLPAPVAVVQHRPVDEESQLCRLLDDASALPVCEPLDGARIAPGQVFLAPADYHLLVDGDHFALSTEGPVSYSRPSADVLFESAAQRFGASVLAVVLTGASEDGAAGAASVAREGGQVLVQDPREARSPVAPRSVKKRVPSAEVLPLDQMAARIAEIVGDGYPWQ